LIGEAADAIRAGAVVAIPTDTLYGLAVDPFHHAAVARVFEVKGRPADRALALIAADTMQLTDRIGPLPPVARALAARFWPGPLTLLIASVPALAPEVNSSGKVGVRVPAHLVARRLCASCGTPLTATSANISGQPASNDPDEVARVLRDLVDLLVDAGTTRGGPPSTVIDATGARPVLVRAGAIGWDEIWRAWNHEANEPLNQPN
jgi:L-threonylcarbamoyladenylate synthase